MTTFSAVVSLIPVQSKEHQGADPDDVPSLLLALYSGFAKQLSAGGVRIEDAAREYSAPRVAIGVRTAVADVYWCFDGINLAQSRTSPFRIGKPQGFDASMLIAADDAEKIVRTGVPPAGCQILEQHGSRELLTAFVKKGPTSWVALRALAGVG